MCTGRGRPVAKSVNARATAAPISSAVDTRWLNAATPRSASVWLRISCSRPVDWRGWRSGIPGETTSSGTLSEYAWPTAAAMFSSAGPVVVIATPGRPLTRAYASAAYPAPCS